MTGPLAFSLHYSTVVITFSYSSSTLHECLNTADTIAGIPPPAGDWFSLIQPGRLELARVG